MGCGVCRCGTALCCLPCGGLCQWLTCAREAGVGVGRGPYVLGWITIESGEKGLRGRYKGARCARKGARCAKRLLARPRAARRGRARWVRRGARGGVCGRVCASRVAVASNRVFRMSHLGVARCLGVGAFAARRVPRRCAARGARLALCHVTISQPWGRRTRALVLPSCACRPWLVPKVDAAPVAGRRAPAAPGRGACQCSAVCQLEIGGRPSCGGGHSGAHPAQKVTRAWGSSQGSTPRLCGRGGPAHSGPGRSAASQGALIKRRCRRCGCRGPCPCAP